MTKTSPVYIRLTEEDRVSLKHEAEHYGVTMTELIRQRILQQRLISKTDKDMIKELRRQGGLLKHIHNESKGAYSYKTKKMLDDMHVIILKLKGITNLNMIKAEEIG